MGLMEISTDLVGRLIAFNYPAMRSRICYLSLRSPRIILAIRTGLIVIILFASLRPLNDGGGSGVELADAIDQTVDLFLFPLHLQRLDICQVMLPVTAAVIVGEFEVRLAVVLDPVGGLVPLPELL